MIEAYYRPNLNTVWKTEILSVIQILRPPDVNKCKSTMDHGDHILMPSVNATFDLHLCISYRQNQSIHFNIT